jgi:putative transposase
LVYHVLNRSNGGQRLFHKDGDYLAFERVLDEAVGRVPLRILAYCVMPNHWHFVVWPKRGSDGEVSEFFRWLTVTHVQRWHAHHHSAGSGHLYQGRFKSFPAQTDEYLYTVLRYVERNAVRANLAKRAEEWRGSSAWRMAHGGAKMRALLSEWPISRPPDWLQRVNRPETAAELEAVRRSVQRGRPFGEASWCARVGKRLGLEYTFRSRGRPRLATPRRVAGTHSA